MRGGNVSLSSFVPIAYQFVAESVGVGRLHSGISSRPFSVAMIANCFTSDHDLKVRDLPRLDKME